MPVKIALKVISWLSVIVVLGVTAMVPIIYSESGYPPEKRHWLLYAMLVDLAGVAVVLGCQYLERRMKRTGGR